MKREIDSLQEVYDRVLSTTRLSGKKKKKTGCSLYPYLFCVHITVLVCMQRRVKSRFVSTVRLFFFHLLMWASLRAFPDGRRSSAPRGISCVWRKLKCLPCLMMHRMLLSKKLFIFITALLKRCQLNGTNYWLTVNAGDIGFVPRDARGRFHSITF